MNNETTIAVCRPTILPDIPALVFLGIALILSPFAGRGVALPCFCVVATLAAIVAARLAMRVYGNKYTFTTRRIVSQHGLLSQAISEVRLEDVRGVNISKSLWGRLFGYASASIGTAATAGAEIRIVNVRGLVAILAKIDTLRNANA